MPSETDIILKKYGISVRSVQTHSPGIYRLSLHVKGNRKPVVMFASMNPADAKRRAVILATIYKSVRLDMLSKEAIRELSLIVSGRL